PVARSQEERMSELLLRGGRPWRFAGPADVLVRDGVIARIEPDIDAPGAEAFDVSGRLVLPGLVEAHCHLDKTLYGRAWEPHTAGDTLADRIGNERRRRGELGLPNADCAAALLERMVTAGTSYVRTHTDVYPGAGLGGAGAGRGARRRVGRGRGGRGGAVGRAGHGRAGGLSAARDPQHSRHRRTAGRGSQTRSGDDRRGPSPGARPGCGTP